jgi:hypothetical protein
MIQAGKGEKEVDIESEEYPPRFLLTHARKGTLKHRQEGPQGSDRLACYLFNTKA